jgi:SAM-dependent methyltransferase
MDFSRILTSTESYYRAKISEHGPSARGVDWSSAESQELRFAQLLRVCEGEGDFSINDYGCGYGALVGFLQRQGRPFRYCGFDISRAMVDRAEELYAGQEGVRFVTDEAELPVADYTVASGIFNVRQETSDETWLAYMLHVIERMRAVSARGFAFNVLTSYSDAEKMRPDLYYADPLLLFDHCKRRYSRLVALLHDYPLYEFTLIVRL